MTQGLKVCILASVQPALHPRLFYTQAVSLARAGYQVTVVAQHPRAETVDGVKVVPVAKPKNRFSRMLVTTVKVIYQGLRERAAVYHIHSPELLPWAILLRLAGNTVLIFDVHENMPRKIAAKYWIPFFLRGPVAIFYKLVERVTLPFYQGLILADESYALNYTYFKNQLVVRNYPPTCKEGYDYSTGNDLRAKGSRLKAVYVGGITEGRGAFQLINAMTILNANGYSDVQLEMVGPVFPPGLYERLVKMIADLSLEEKISLTPHWVSRDKVWRSLAQADIGLAILDADTAASGSLPTKLFEYMRAGIPIVASAHQRWQPVLAGCALQVDPVRPEEIAKAIETLHDRPELRKKLGEKGRRAVGQRYNWEKEAGRLLDFYQRLLSEAGSKLEPGRGEQG
jgi:glycosyltransferase involved in cell wall biosynthesis